MIRVGNNSVIVVEPKGVGLNIVLKTKDANKQEKAYTFTLPMSRVPAFYGSLFGKNYFATKSNQQYSLVVMHSAMMNKKQKKNNTNEVSTATVQSSPTQSLLLESMLPGVNETPSATSTAPTQSSTTQTNTQTSEQTEKSQDKIPEFINLLVYENLEGGKRSPKYVARFTVTRANIPRLKQEIKKAIKQIDKWALRTKSITLTKAGPVFIITQNANQLILDYTNKGELKDELTEFIMSNREEYTISKIKFTKDDAMTLLSLLTHMEI
ncbi:MAG: hypothetical protein RXR65_02820 [Hydrogenobaculum sp.]